MVSPNWEIGPYEIQFLSDPVTTGGAFPEMGSSYATDSASVWYQRDKEAGDMIQRSSVPLSTGPTVQPLKDEFWPSFWSHFTFWFAFVMSLVVLFVILT